MIVAMLPWDGCQQETMVHMAWSTEFPKLSLVVLRAFSGRSLGDQNCDSNIDQTQRMHSYWSRAFCMHQRCASTLPGVHVTWEREH